ncbi:hypothetical protein CLV63_116121 [Murinocardiopsis flavida]|uniref:Uncharacterized protein n=1 Tax=Murinocardiopsis flavida TaxID=645275 RepID=A0A2P8D918_9ACTN|nr:hypothetical protein [Murinocardiopsis flavida]PSK93714.1 hypothetical protein CLV63_116121 [Murinocardiopsis flavida]
MAPTTTATAPGTAPAHETAPRTGPAESGTGTNPTETGTRTAPAPSSAHRTAGPGGSSEYGPLLPAPRADDPVGHGYTAFQAVRLAVWAARECNWVNAMAMTHRAETAWEAITEHLQTAPERPAETELIAVGWKAIKTQHYHDLRTRGLAGADKALLSRAFVRYWTDLSAPTGGHEDAIVDRLALAQIWAVLRPGHRKVLTALAETEDRHCAGQALGMDPTAFTRALGRARKAFYALWHEGEAPARMWGADRTGERHQNVMYLVRLRGRKARARKAQGIAARPLGRAPIDLGVANAVLLDRHVAGESYGALARAFGVSRDTIIDRITRARTQRTADSTARTGAPPR